MLRPVSPDQALHRRARWDPPRGLERGSPPGSDPARPRAEITRADAFVPAGSTEPLIDPRSVRGVAILELTRAPGWLDRAQVDSDAMADVHAGDERDRPPSESPLDRRSHGHLERLLD